MPQVVNFSGLLNRFIYYWGLNVAESIFKKEKKEQTKKEKQDKKKTEKYKKRKEKKRKILKNATKKH